MASQFEDLEIWKESIWISLEIYKIMNRCTDFGFKDQIQRSAISVPSNISEGFERQTNKEFIQFLFIAKGSCGELRTQIHLGYHLKYINKEEYDILLDKAKMLSSKIGSFIKIRKTFQS